MDTNLTFLETAFPEKETSSLPSTLVSDRRARKILTPKADMAIRLYIAGHSLEAIELKLSYSRQSLISILRSKPGRELMEELREQHNDLFLSLFPKVTERVKEGLEHPDPQVNLGAANIWLRETRADRIKINKGESTEDLMNSLLHDEQEDKDEL